MEKLKILSFSVLFLVGNLSAVYADGVEDFLVTMCNFYPSWLQVNYPDPSPELYNPINITLETTLSVGDHVNATFTGYQMFDHSNADNWQFTNWNVDLASETIEVVFQVRKTKFGGKYRAEGIYNGVPISGQGTWNITTADPSYISFGLHYDGAKVTDDGYVDLNGGPIESLHYYVPVSGIPSVREMDGLVAGEQETLLRNDIFNALEMQTQYMKEHPLPIPLNAYLQVAFAGTPISDMRKPMDRINQS